MFLICKNGDFIHNADELKDKLNETFENISTDEIMNKVEFNPKNNPEVLNEMDIDLIKDHLYCNVDQNENKQEIIDDFEEVLVLLSKIKSKNPALTNAVEKIYKNIHKLQFDIFAI